MTWLSILAIIVTGWPAIIAIVLVVLFLHYSSGWSLVDAGIVGILAWAAVALFLRREIMSKAYYNQGRSQYERQAYDEAEASYRKAIDLNPRNAWAYGNLAIVLDDQGRHAEALPVIDKAIWLDPYDDDFSEWRRDILKHLGSGAPQN